MIFVLVLIFQFVNFTNTQNVTAADQPKPSVQQSCAEKGASDGKKKHSQQDQRNRLHESTILECIYVQRENCYASLENDGSLKPCSRLYRNFLGGGLEVGVASMEKSPIKIFLKERKRKECIYAMMFYSFTFRRDICLLIGGLPICAFLPGTSPDVIYT